MLLQQIVHQLDTELVRLRSLRGIVSGLAKSPAIVRSLAPRIEKLLEAAPKPVAAAPRVAASTPEAPRRRGRPRKVTETPVLTPAPARKLRVSRIPRVPRASRTAEPTALAKAVSAGPVVVSAAALARERETRATAKAAPAKNAADSQQAEVRPELFARELAARWLSPAKG